MTTNIHTGSFIRRTETPRDQGPGTRDQQGNNAYAHIEWTSAQETSLTTQ